MEKFNLKVQPGYLIGLSLKESVGGTPLGSAGSRGEASTRWCKAVLSGVSDRPDHADSPGGPGQSRPPHLARGGSPYPPPEHPAPLPSVIIM